MATSPLTNLLTNDFWGTPLSHSGSHKSYRPLCSLTFKLNTIWSGLNPYGFHLVNILLHCIATYLFTQLAKSQFSKSKSKAAIIISSLAFALNPIHTEAVAGIVGRADILAGIFFLSALLTFDQYQKSMKIKNEGTRPFLIWTVFFATLAMFCKESGITVLGVCLVSLLARKPSKSAILSLVLAIMGLLVLRGQIMGFQPPKFAKADNPVSASKSVISRFLTLLYLPVFNFWLMLCPNELSFDWSMDAIPLINGLGDPRNGLSAVFYGAWMVLSWKQRKVRKEG